LHKRFKAAPAQGAAFLFIGSAIFADNLVVSLFAGKSGRREENDLRFKTYRLAVLPAIL
jgi:hypothetical protein